MLPLAGLRVIEVSSFVAAPLGGMTLAQLGADVIRVDPLGGAADQHRWPLTKSGTSLYWAGLNKGKRSITVDLRAPEGRAVVSDLVAACLPGTAVVLTNAVGRQGLSFEELKEVQPDVIHVQVEGKSDGTPAVDYTVNAEVGFPMVTGPQGHADPINHVLPAWDIACGLYAAIGVIAADRRRRETGEGESIRVALHDVALAMAGNLGLLAEAQVNHVRRERIGNYLYGGFARDFVSRDGGRFMVVALTQRHWRDLLTVTEMQAPVAALEQSLKVNFAIEDHRFEYREVLAGLFARWFAEQTTTEIAQALGATSLLWSPYRTFAEAITELQASEGTNPLMSVLDQPGVGPHLAPRSPLTFASASAAATPAPQLGQHTVEILERDLSLRPHEIEALLTRGHVQGVLQ